MVSDVNLGDFVKVSERGNELRYFRIIDALRTFAFFNFYYFSKIYDIRKIDFELKLL